VTRTLRPAALLGLSALILAGCGGRDVMSQRPQAPCPRVALLAEAADLTRYRAGARPDLGTMEVDARLLGFQARCDYAPRDGGLDVILLVEASAERGPAATTAAAELPFFIAVTEEGETARLSLPRKVMRMVSLPRFSTRPSPSSVTAIRKGSSATGVAAAGPRSAEASTSSVTSSPPSRGA
jgi:hypothetical protein